MDEKPVTSEHTLTLGRYLSELREKKGMSLADLSERTKITLAQLESFEQDNLNGLPPKSFSLGFLRSLCMELNGDYNQAKQLYFVLSNDIVEMYTQQRAAASKEPQPSAETREVMSRNISLSPYIFGVIVVALMVVAVYFYAADSRPTPQASSAGLNIIEEVRRNSVVLDAIAESEELPLFAPEYEDSFDDAPITFVPAPGEVIDTATVTPPTTSTPAEVVAPRDVVVTPAATPVAPVVAEAPAPQVVAEPTIFEVHAVTEPVRVSLRGKGQVWVKMVGNKGKTIRTTTLNQGGTLELLSDSEVIVSLGNAALVDVSIDGKLLAPVGTRGEVRRFIVRNDRSLDFMTRVEYLALLSNLGVPE